jgi:parallel beta-helix repeat protein
MESAYADKVNILNSDTAIASGAGAAGKPTLSNFNIPAGKNRALLLMITFERDHCDLNTDICKGTSLTTTNAATAGLEDNSAFETGSPTTDITVRARITGTTSLDKANALVVGGTPSGDLRYHYSRTGTKSSGVVIPKTTRYSLESFFIAFYESELATALGGANTGNISISLPFIATPKSTGDEATIHAVLLENVLQNSEAGIVRSNTSQNLASDVGVAANSSFTVSALDASQSPISSNDALLINAINTTPGTNTNGGFNNITGFTRLLSTAIINANGRYDKGDITTDNVTLEPDGLSASTFFKNGLFSSFTVQSAISSASKIGGVRAATFTITAYEPDVSDAPTSYGVARHEVVGIRLGANADIDAGDLSSTDALGDDSNGTDDDDGMTLTSFTPNTSTSLTANIQSAPGYLNMWIDWNRDGDFNDASESVVSDQAVAIGSPGLTISTPAGLTAGSSFARIRVCSTTNQCKTPTGDAISGEVEDYAITINNVAPVITSNGGGASASISVNEGQTAVTTVTATDANNDTLSYSITGGADSAKFSVNSATGVLTFITAPNYSSPTDSGANNIYDVQVTASDGKGGADMQAIAVTVLNVNYPPVITSNGGGANAAISINEEQIAVTTVSATDPDNDVLAYSISGGVDAAKFSIDSTFGVLQLKTAPIYSTPTDSNSDNVYEVQVTAADGKGGTDMQAIAVTIINTATAVIAGTVFDDVNYGGGAGRSKAASSGAGINGAIVELYNNVGTLVATQTTTSGGTYSFNYLKAGTYYVRVVNDTVRSSRAVMASAERGVQTFRTNGTTATTNEVGGYKPTLVDGAANTGAQLLNTSTYLLDGTVPVQTLQPVTVTTTTITGVDFGFNFSTIVNTNDAGQGSLRQFILNSNLLSNTGLDQVDNPSDGALDPVAGVESAIFMIAGAGPHIINLVSALPNITSADTALDGSTQSGASCTANNRILKVGLDGTSAGATISGITVDAANVTIRGLAMGKFTDAGITGTANADNFKLTCSNIGLAVDGVTAAMNGTHGVYIKAGATNLTIGGSSDNDRNIIANNYRDGVRLEGVTNAIIERNYLGLTASGTTARSNNQEGSSYAGLSVNAASNTIAIRNNVISGNDMTTGVPPVVNVSTGIRLEAATAATANKNITIVGNLIGTTPAGTTALANSGYGIYIKYSTDITVGGTTVADRNIISGNGKDAINTRIGTARLSILGNYIGTDINGSVAIPNTDNGIFLADSSTVTIGNSTSAGRNIISANKLSGIRNSTSTGTVIAGNYVGLDITGKLNLGNTLHGIYVQNSANVKVGGSALVDRNVVAANKTIGIFITGATSNTRIENNLVGLATDGDTAMGNTQAGIELSGTSGAVVHNNIVSANKTRGVHLINSATSTTISNNTIGLNEAGTTKRGNGYFGIDVDPPASNLAITGNIISGNTKHGINFITGSTAAITGNTVTNNWIGLGKDGVTALGNTESGIRIEGANGIVVGGAGTNESNIIAYNGTDGISILGNNSINNTISRNAIYGNTGLGIDLDDNDVTLNDGVTIASTGNKGLNFPQFSQIGYNGATLVLKGCAPEGATIELFEADVSSTSASKIAAGANKFGRSTDYGEGERYLMTLVEGVNEDTVTKEVDCTVLIDADGNTAADMKPFKWTVTAPADVLLGDRLTATATLATIGTSEFSPADLVVVANEPPEITSNGGGDTATISVLENQPLATIVTATDPNNDPLTYSIGGGLDASLFVINTSTGVLRFVNSPDFEFPSDANNDNTYEVQVVAKDDKGATDTQLLLVNVTNVAELVTLQLNALLQGPYRKDTHLMVDMLRTKNYLPLTQPYNKAPYNYTGTETIKTELMQVTGFSAIVDWVLIELRSASSPTTILGRKAALLLRSGQVVEAATGSSDIQFNEVDSGNYYVVLRHRNHLGVITANPLALSKTPIAIDFSHPATAVMGGESRMLTDDLAVLWAGDANMDSGVVANGPSNDPSYLLGAVLLNFDNSLLNSNFIINGYTATDLDMNGFTLFAGPGNDLNILVGSVLLHPSNSTMSANFIIQSGMPRIK